MQAPELKARGLPPQLQSSSPQNTSPSQSIPLSGGRQNSSSYLGIHSILNPAHEGPKLVHHDGLPSATTSAEQKPSGTMPTAEGCAETLSQFSRRTLIPKTSSRITGTRRATSQGDVNARLLISPESDQAYMVTRGLPASPELPQLPIPPAQSHKQHYGSLTTSWPAPDAWGSTVGTMQDPVKSESAGISASLRNPPSSQTSPTLVLYGKIGQPSHTSTSHDPDSSFGRTVQQGGVMPFQGTPEAPGGSHDALGNQSQQRSFRSGSACSLGQTSASDPIPVLTMTTSEGSYNVPVDVHHASRLADEKRARNAGASARFRQRRKEKEKDANNTIERLQTQTRDQERRISELEQERDFYRGERDRLRDVVFKTPELKHHAMWRPPSPQSLRTASFQGLMVQTADPQAPPQTEFHATNPNSERAPKRRRTSTQGGYTSTEELPPVTTHTPPLAGFPPRSTLAPQKTAPSALLPSTSMPRSDAPYIRSHTNEDGLEAADEVNNSHYTRSFGLPHGTQYISHRLHTNTSFNFPTSNLLSHNVSRTIVSLM